MYHVLLTPDFREWLNSLDAAVADRVLSVLDRMAEGNWGDYKPLPGVPVVFERRLMGRGPGIRLYFCRQSGDTLLMLTAGDKATQQRRDIGRARRLREVYQE
jgi:putative addiction module killer protein